MDLEACLVYVQRCFGLSGGATYNIVKEPIVPAVVLDTCNMGMLFKFLHIGMRVLTLFILITRQ